MQNESDNNEKVMGGVGWLLVESKVYKIKMLTCKYFIIGIITWIKPNGLDQKFKKNSINEIKGKG